MTYRRLRDIAACGSEATWSEASYMASVMRLRTRVAMLEMDVEKLCECESRRKAGER